MSESPTPRERDDRPSAYGFNPAELEEFVGGLGEPRYRADQIWRWLYRHFATSFDEMTDLPLDLRARLHRRLRFHTVALVAATRSDDGLATKFLFRLQDDQMIETVLMHYVDPADLDDDDNPEGEDRGDPDAGVEGFGSADGAAPIPTGRHTVCLSTQAGCAMGCVFCATGQMGLVRDLTAHECVEQVVFCARALHEAGERLGNVVFMGMGEPLANWDATWRTVETLMDAGGFGIGARHITISTVGIVPGIHRLAETGVPVRLAVSIHAGSPALRTALVPIDETYGLDQILDACRSYQRRTGRRITFEYVLIEGVNDAPRQARLLAARLEGLLAHVNLIPVNPTAGSPYAPSPYPDAVAFQTALRDAGIPTTLRMRRGIEIQAGCGQLRSHVSEERLGRSIPRASPLPSPA